MSDTTIIRKAEPADLAEIARVNLETWHRTYKDVYPADFVASMTLEKIHREWELTLQDRNPSIRWFVAQEGKSLVGYAGAGRIPDSGLEHGSELYSVIVAPSHQNKGTGARLVGEVSRFLKGLGVNSLMAWIPEENPFHRFFLKNGGEQIENEMEIDYGGKRVKVICFGWKDLDGLAKL